VRYLDAVVSDATGEPEVIENAICIHEEDVGVFWKHTNWRTASSHVARARRLSLSFFCTVANYDYGFYWHFYQDGTIEMEVKMTGILNTSPLSPGDRNPTYGVVMRPGLGAPIHQHFFNVRLDMCVDGPRNIVQEVNVEQSREGKNVQMNAFMAKTTTFRKESQAQRSVEAREARHWRVVNPRSKNLNDEPVAYRLVPGENTWPFAKVDAPLMKRAVFLNKHLWVTPFHPRERYPAGDYPNQHLGGDGLPLWTKQDRNISDTNVVLWYTLGALHVPRLEEWPVMPVVRLSFSLKPDGFFNRNPTSHMSQMQENCEANRSKL
jgi:primary-amine oxidase